MIVTIPVTLHSLSRLFSPLSFTCSSPLPSGCEFSGSREVDSVRPGCSEGVRSGTASGLVVVVGRVSVVRVGNCHDCLCSVRSSWRDWRMGFLVFLASVPGLISQFLFWSLFIKLPYLFLLLYIFSDGSGDSAVLLSGSFWFPGSKSSPILGLLPSSFVFLVLLSWVVLGTFSA